MHFNLKVTLNSKTKVESGYEVTDEGQIYVIQIPVFYVRTLLV